MTKKILLTLFVAWAIISAEKASAQMATDSVALNHIVANYYTAIDRQSHLYNGPEYEFYDPVIKGNAYVFNIREFTPGSVKYDGVIYYNVPMLYDINKDVVVILLYNHFTKISLLSNRVSEFWLHNHHFVYINADAAGKHPVSAGFYDQLYAGKNISILVKRAKAIQNVTAAVTIETLFTETTDYYLKKGNDYFGFGGKGALLDLLKDKKKELRQYIKTSNIDYRENPEPAMTGIGAYYDHLVN
ncbi:hypothetical protein [Mucilaginibacter celer]|uniref:Uncharacterized protein n=1 Tax=Mucilaginibacter celer TaxID=2305508 RepID=A0A494VWP2_9SPHI|nr:hypothetical protein [Mucilaginibacter celer]AYL98511.1 hypothetical protein HYN43_025940 [Mucilaginibacter celer]